MLKKKKKTQYLVPMGLHGLKSIIFLNSSRTHQIEAAPTSSSVDGFKANLVFKEIEKKLEDVSTIYVKYYQEDRGLVEVDTDFGCCHEVV